MARWLGAGWWVRIQGQESWKDLGDHTVHLFPLLPTDIQIRKPGRRRAGCVHLHTRLPYHTPLLVYNLVTRTNNEIDKVLCSPERAHPLPIRRQRKLRARCQRAPGCSLGNPEPSSSSGAHQLGGSELPGSSAEAGDNAFLGGGGGKGENAEIWEENGVWSTRKSSC